MNRHTALMSACVLVTAANGYADSLTVTAEATDATVAAAVEGELRLPDLEIDTIVSAECDDGRPPVSLSLSSADTIRQIDLDADGGDGRWHFLFTLPASQVPPVLAREFCLADPEAGEDSTGRSDATLDKLAFVSVRASLRCGADGEDRMTSETALVDVKLVCQREAIEVPDQDSSE